MRHRSCSVSCRGTKCEPKRSTWAPRVLALVVISVAAYNIVQFGDLQVQRDWKKEEPNFDEFQAIECLHPDNYTLFELCPTEMRISETYVIVYKWEFSFSQDQSTFLSEGTYMHFPWRSFHLYFSPSSPCPLSSCFAKKTRQWTKPTRMVSNGSKNRHDWSNV